MVIFFFANPTKNLKNEKIIVHRLVVYTRTVPSAYYYIMIDDILYSNKTRFLNSPARIQLERCNRGGIIHLK